MTRLLNRIFALLRGKTKDQRRATQQKSFNAAFATKPMESVHFNAFDPRYTHAAAMEKMHQMAQGQGEQERW